MSDPNDPGPKPPPDELGETLDLSDARTRMDSQGVARQDGESPALREGELLGRYRIGRLLGRGGMGQVYAAEEIGSHRQVALKVVNPSVATVVSRERFLREGQLAASVNHPNSVYVFGTEAIDTTLVISMELMAGGTLADVVTQRGPLPYAQAVDAALQIVAGLRAAESQGVLHRDVKPANCFVDEDGTVKVGDYGLSKPSLDAEQTALTEAGAVMGTPSFAPPEQLKGEAVDVRADIYAVGATLFYLLTGECPFSGGNAVQIISAVLSEPPGSLPKLANAAPPGLKKLVLRCLEKDPARRPQTHDELEHGLRPFGSESPRPAPTGRRLLAGAFDMTAALTFSLIQMLLLGRFLPVVHSNEMIGIAGLCCWYILFFALSESLFAATAGKLIFGLRVVPLAGGRLRTATSFARAALFGTPFVIHLWLSQLLRPGPPVQGELLLNLLIYFAFPLVLFLGAHRDSGWRGLHDRWSRSSVSTRRRSGVASRRNPLPPAGLLPVDGERSVAAFRVVARLEAAPGASIVVARDDVLERDVWLHEHESKVGTTAARRALSRPSRLRWLAGAAGWDAYEAIDGQAMASFDEPLPWESVRPWLLAAAAELAAGAAVTELVAPEQLWITRDARLKLVEANMLGFEVTAVDNGWERAQQLLARVAGRALAPGQPTSDGVPRVPLPLEARSILERLARAGFKSPAEFHAEPALRRETTWSLGKKRAFSLGLQGAPAVASVSFMALVFLLAFVTPGFFEGQVVLTQSLAHLGKLESPTCERQGDWESDRRAAQILVSDGIRKTGELAARLSGPSGAEGSQEGFVRGLRRDQRELARAALLAHPSPTDADVRWAREQMAQVLDVDPGGVVGEMRGWPLRSWFAIGSFSASVPLAVIGVAAMITALLFGNGALFRLLGLAVVRRDGAPATRGRLLLRAAVVWSLPLACLASPLMLSKMGTIVFATTTAAVMLIGALWALGHPSRALQDRIAGTGVVPR